MKEVVVAAIGGIGLPESLPCLDSLIKLVDEKKLDPQVKCMAVWAIGRLACLRAIKMAKKVIKKSLLDPFYKVRATACGTLV